MKISELKNKKIAVLGVGVEGMALINFLKEHGAQITIYDQKEETEHDENTLSKIKELGLPVLFGAKTFPNLSSFNIIFRSPGIKHTHEAIAEARKHGAIVTSQTQLFFDLCPCPIIGITGTKGKGTTSSLIYEMLKEEGYSAYLGGNIGTPPISFLNLLTPESKVILEMSSFQLQDLSSSPHVAVMLMTTSEHLDYHKDVYEYIDAKRNIFRYQKSGDYAIVNRDYPASNESDIYTEAKIYRVSRVQDVDQGCFVKNNAIYIKINGKDQKVIDTKDILLPGKHNLENVCAAIAASMLSGAKTKAIVTVLKTFKGLEHRLELFKTVNGVRYYDDSFSTTPETAIAAIEAFTEPEILILGGSSKNSDFTELGKTIDHAKNIKAIVVGGMEWIRIKETISKQALSKIKIIEGSKNMHEMVEIATKEASLGDIVLLSPACASFDMFKSYKHRGEEFKKSVLALSNKG